MDFSFLSFLAEPGFVIPWYLVGAAGAAYVALDLKNTNTPLKQAMKWAWPIIVFFFSVIGLVLYFATARAPGIGRARSEEEKMKLHHAYERNMVRRVNGAVIHCVAGDGLGIMTAMVIARVTGMTFWQEFWFEYAVGFAFGWLIFQFKSMTMMTDSKAMALWMAFRAEFFSMLTVMGGMGAVMTYVTPMVVGAQPQPTTFAFWGFGMLGLLVGYVFTFPMNWMIVKIGWKHGMGSKKDSHPVKSSEAKGGLAAAMVAMGIAALVLPAWLTQVRIGKPVPSAAKSAGNERGSATALSQGLRQSLRGAADNLARGRRAEATNALDAAMRAAHVGEKALPGAGFRGLVNGIDGARRRLQNGDPDGAQREARATLEHMPSANASEPATGTDLRKYAGVPVVNARGVMIGEVQRVQGDEVELALGGSRDVWGAWDIGDARTLSVPADGILWGPKKAIGKSYVMLPTLERREAIAAR